MYVHTWKGCMYSKHSLSLNRIRCLLAFLCNTFCVLRLLWIRSDCLKRKTKCCVNGPEDKIYFNLKRMLRINASIHSNIIGVHGFWDRKSQSNKGWKSTVGQKHFADIFVRGMPEITIRGHDIFADWDLKVDNLLYFLNLVKWPWWRLYIGYL